MADQDWTHWKDTSRLNWRTKRGQVDKEHVQAGAIMRIADAMEKIEKHLHAMTPEAIAARELRMEQQKQHEKEYERCAEIQRWLGDLVVRTIPPPARCSVWMLADAFVRTHGLGGDCEQAEDWLEIIGVARGFGHDSKRAELLRAWIARVFK